MKSDRLYLQHILDALQAIERYTEGIDEAGFLSHPMMQDAVVRQLEIVGEAARRISDPLRERHPDIPWRGLIGLRNRIAHEYIDVDLQII